MFIVCKMLKKKTEIKSLKTIILDCRIQCKTLVKKVHLPDTTAEICSLLARPWRASTCVQSSIV